MVATVINVVSILLGSFLGLVCKKYIHKRFTDVVISTLGLCVLGIGVSGMAGTKDTLCVIVCMVLGTLLGEALDIEGRLEGVGELLKAKLVKGDGASRFTEGFVSAFLLFCVGAMAITGSIEAGLNHNYSILITKSVMDGVVSISFAAAMGVGVAFSVVPLFLYQGAITLLAAWVGPYLPQEVVVEMSAVGSTLIAALSINVLGLRKDKLKVGNMLPAMFLPIIYIPLVQWLGALVG